MRNAQSVTVQKTHSSGSKTNPPGKARQNSNAANLSREAVERSRPKPAVKSAGMSAVRSANTTARAGAHAYAATTGPLPLPNSRAVTATEAKNQFRRVFDSARGDEIVVITRHGEPQAVLLSYERYVAMARAGSSVLDTLTGHFDAMLAGMQTADVRKGTFRGFAARPEDMANAAVAVAAPMGRKRTAVR